jgi:hypothetical protein
MERLLADARDESSSNEIARGVSRKRRKTGHFLYAIYSICGATDGQALQKEIHSKKIRTRIASMDHWVKPGGDDVRAIAGTERSVIRDCRAASIPPRISLRSLRVKRAWLRSVQIAAVGVVIEPGVVAAVVEAQLAGADTKAIAPGKVRMDAAAYARTGQTAADRGASETAAHAGASETAAHMNAAEAATDVNAAEAATDVTAAEAATHMTATTAAAACKRVC